MKRTEGEKRNTYNGSQDGRSGKERGVVPESPVPLHVGEPRGVPETLGERVTIDLQLGDLLGRRNV